jgi:membrane fusion protein, multidrug efflux system
MTSAPQVTAPQPLPAPKKPVGRILAVVFFVVLGLASLWYVLIRPFESTDNAYLKADITLLTPKIGGYVTEVRVRDHQFVEAGAVIARIDDRDYKAKADEAEADAEAARAKVKTLIQQRAVNLANLQAADAVLSGAKSTATLANKDLSRARDLRKTGTVSQKWLDDAADKQTNSTATLARNNAQRAAAEEQLKESETEIAEAEATVRMKEAALQLAMLDVENTTIRAPVSGKIGNKTVQVGQLVKAGTALASLIPEDIWVEANYKEIQVSHMHIGQPVKIQVDALPDTKFMGTISSLSPATGSEFSLLPAENATGNFTKIVRRVPVKITFDPGQDLSQLKPGLSVSTRIRVR